MKTIMFKVNIIIWGGLSPQSTKLASSRMCMSMLKGWQAYKPRSSQDNKLTSWQIIELLDWQMTGWQDDKIVEWHGDIVKCYFPKKLHQTVLEKGSEGLLPIRSWLRIVSVPSRIFARGRAWECQKQGNEEMTASWLLKVNNPQGTCSTTTTCSRSNCPACCSWTSSTT